MKNKLSFRLGAALLASAFTVGVACADGFVESITHPGIGMSDATINHAGAPVADEQITSQVAAALAQDSRLVTHEPLRVHTVNGRVFLEGKVATAPQVYLAVKTAWKVEGVTAVDDDGLQTF